MLAYHFTNENKLRNGQPLPAIGEWLVHDGPIVPCENGLHASEHPFDALRYAPGYTLHQVELEGDLIPHGNPVDKWVGRKRKILKSVDAKQTIIMFAKWSALQAIHLWKPNQVILDFLNSETHELDNAANAASYAAAYASYAAAYVATNAAAYNAAADAAYAAAYATNAAAYTAYAANAAANAAADAANTDIEPFRKEFKARIDKLLNQ